MEYRNDMHSKGENHLPYRDVDINGDEIDLKEVIVKLWGERKFILIVTGIFLLIGIFIAFTSPVSYKASCTVVPQAGEKGGNLGGLASIMGVNLGANMSAETLSPTVYPNIVNSVPFCKEIMNTPIVLKDFPNDSVTLYEYYTNQKYYKTSVLEIVKKYTIGLPGTLLSAMRSNSSEKDDLAIYSDTISGQVISLTKEEREVFEIVKNNIQFASNSKDGYITLGYAFAEPEATAIISRQLYNVLEKYVKNFKTQKQLDNLQFVEEGYEEARKDFYAKQERLASFQDENRNLISATARATEKRLNSEYDVAFTVYNEMAKQREQAKLALKESTPVLTVIDPVVVPNQKSAPKRGMIMVVFLFLGIVLSIGWVLVKPFFREVTSGLKEI